MLSQQLLYYMMWLLALEIVSGWFEFSYFHCSFVFGLWILGNIFLVRFGRNQGSDSWPTDIGISFFSLEPTATTRELLVKSMGLVPHRQGAIYPRRSRGMTQEESAGTCNAIKV
ncbi:hypothetical protein ILUMI_23929, partial [Ignelater luminosus]